MKADVRWADEHLTKAKAKVLTIEEVRSKYPDEILILTKGVFDVLHSGHLALFCLLIELRSANTNAITVVAVAEDRLVRAKKGSDRPIQSFDERALQVALHPGIDVVVRNISNDLTALISLLNPQIFIKGQDTALASENNSRVDTVTLDETINPEVVSLTERRARLIVFRDNGETSTSLLIGRIRDSEPTKTG
jgi:bifunctional ADP-heptose synthase (sugar kinase/adenylyltransferase)